MVAASEDLGTSLNADGALLWLLFEQISRYAQNVSKKAVLENAVRYYVEKIEAEKKSRVTLICALILLLRQA
ncbi:MAG: hypothetical protein HGJ94_17880 [Desulfosarcina sp.]|nr:hypothetical protein [Desulfosarcina sp.]MBC2742153.1 hypothetical protein [Desulfosarcina sp.]MBC2765065.1 hypothetical protein [Desulfosarcina sp.]